MASINTPNLQSWVAGTDLSGSQYLLMMIETTTAVDRNLTTGTSTTGPVVGILQNAPTDGAEALIAMPGGGGQLKMACACNAGDRITCGTDGRGTRVTTQYDMVYAEADEAASGANSVIAVTVVRYQSATGSYAL